MNGKGYVNHKGREFAVVMNSGKIVFSEKLDPNAMRNKRKMENPLDTQSRKSRSPKGKTTRSGYGQTLKSTMDILSDNHRDVYDSEKIDLSSNPRTGTSKRTTPSKRTNHTTTSTDRLMKEHLSTNMFIPSQLSKLYRNNDEMNYNVNNMPNFIENHEDELLFLHGWLNPATHEKTKQIITPMMAGDYLNQTYRIGGV
jgi:hypothetical protein